MNRFRSTARSLALLITLTTLSGCGFHLRGSEASSTLNAASVFVSSQGAGRVAELIRNQLTLRNVAITTETDQAEYTLRLSNELRDRQVLTVSSVTGKVQEYELNYSVTMAVIDQQGNTIAIPQTIYTSRDLFFDENAVLAVGNEESLIYQELEQQAANTILRRLQASIQ